MPLKIDSIRSIETLGTTYATPLGPLRKRHKSSFLRLLAYKLSIRIFFILILNVLQKHYYYCTEQFSRTLINFLRLCIHPDLPHAYFKE